MPSLLKFRAYWVYHKSMKIDFKRFLKGGQKFLIISISTIILIGVFPFLEPAQKAEADLTKICEETPEGLIFFQENSLLGVSEPNNPEPKVVKKIRVMVTAYSSTPSETDDTPFITAAGTSVRDGIVANNKYPFGTKIRIPELYGDKIFVVEDRLHCKTSNYLVDIWFPSRQDALNFGAKITYIEILES